MNIGIEAGTDPDGRLVLTVAGAIDVQSRDALLTAGKNAFSSDGTATAAKGLVLDLADVSFIDSTGIGALVELGHDAEDADAEFAIRNPSVRVMRVLEITGLSTAWPMEQTAD